MNFNQSYTQLYSGLEHKKQSYVLASHSKNTFLHNSLRVSINLIRNCTLNIRTKCNCNNEAIFYGNLKEENSVHRPTENIK